jgi:predicted CXXCH cytochrome family protein
MEAQMKVRLFFAVGLLALLCLPAGLALADNGPHGGYTATTDACAGCHRAHTALDASLLYSAAPGDAFCYTCHDGTGAPALPVVSTHSNADFAGRAEASFTLFCVQCHDPHGSASNLYSIRKDILVQVGASPVVSGPVVFTATTGINSYDDGASAPASRICVTCHNNSDNSGYPMTDHVGGASHTGPSDKTGQDCTTCHFHSKDADRDTLDGFMP